MKQTIEISRESIMMAATTLSNGVPEMAKTFVLKILETRLTGILSRFPGIKRFRLTMETFEQDGTPEQCSCYDIMAKDPKRHFRECMSRT